MVGMKLIAMLASYVAVAAASAAIALAVHDHPAPPEDDGCQTGYLLEDC
jgi:hypothetical protein